MPYSPPHDHHNHGTAPGSELLRTGLAGEDPTWAPSMLARPAWWRVLAVLPLLLLLWLAVWWANSGALPW